MNIVQLNVENFKRLVAVEIAPGADGSLVLVTGRNAAGKSSVLDSIESVLRGAKADPEVPIRRGASRATVKIDLGDLIATRTWTKDGTKLTVQSKDGALYPTPQAVLDRLAGKIALDPLAFSRMEPAKQLETLRGIVGLDFTELDQQRAAAYFNRTETNREQKTAQAWADAAQRYPDAPTEEVLLADLVAQKDELASFNQGLAEAGEAARDAERAAKSFDDAMQSASKSESVECERIARTLEQSDTDLEQQIAQLRDNHERRKNRTREESKKILADVREMWQAAQSGKQINEKRAKEMRSRLDGKAMIDLTSITQRIAGAEATNSKVRQNAKAAELDAKAKALAEKSATLTAKIEAIEAEKRDKLAAAKFPIPDLSFDEHGVTFRGVPFAQASSAERLRASVAIGLAMSPKLRVLLIRDGSLLDAEGMAALAKIAEEQGVQCWIERVSGDSPVGIVIEDGMVQQTAGCRQKARHDSGPTKQLGSN